MALAPLLFLSTIGVAGNVQRPLFATFPTACPEAEAQASFQGPFSCPQQSLCCSFSDTYQNHVHRCMAYTQMGTPQQFSGTYLDDQYSSFTWKCPQYPDEVIEVKDGVSLKKTLANQFLGQNDYVLLGWRVVVSVVLAVIVVLAQVKMGEFFLLYYHNWALLLNTLCFWLLTFQSATYIWREETFQGFEWLIERVFLGVYPELRSDPVYQILFKNKTDREIFDEIYPSLNELLDNLFQLSYAVVVAGAVFYVSFLYQWFLNQPAIISSQGDANVFIPYFTIFLPYMVSSVEYFVDYIHTYSRDYPVWTLSLIIPTLFMYSNIIAQNFTYTPKGIKLIPIYDWDTVSSPVVACGFIIVQLFVEIGLISLGNYKVRLLDGKSIKEV